MFLGDYSLRGCYSWCCIPLGAKAREIPDLSMYGLKPVPFTTEKAIGTLEARTLHD
jgi:hypothetical protein